MGLKLSKVREKGVKGCTIILLVLAFWLDLLTARK